MRYLLAFILFLALSTTASAFCEFGNLVRQNMVGNHIEAIYDFGQGRLLAFSFPFGTMVPGSIRYDFWEGHMCQ